MIRVVVAEDSPTVRELLVSILESEEDIRVVGQARNGREAVDLALRLRPDLITMDVQMPVLDGLEATKEIMVGAPTPILIVSSRAVSPSQVELSLDALKAGALMVVPTPVSPLSEGFDHQRAQLVSMVRAMSQVKVVRRWSGRTSAPPPAPRGAKEPVRLVAIGASTGGPAAVQQILSALPRDFPVPIVLVQHIAAEFATGLAQWLASSCRLRVRIAEQGERMEARTAYLSPDHRHLGVRRDGTIALSAAAPIGGFRPSATALFASVARAYGPRAAAVILTGMGRDGVDGLRLVHESGGLVIAQDEATSVVYGMPREAVIAGVVNEVLPLQEIAPRLAKELHTGATE